MHGVLGGQRYTTGTDDDHYEQIEVAQIDDKMAETTNAALTRHNTDIRHCLTTLLLKLMVTLKFYIGGKALV